MPPDATVLIHFKDVPTSTRLREHLEKRCLHLAEEFPETSHYELTLSPETNSMRADARANGKGTTTAAHANAEDLRQAAERAIDKLERELRKGHDKRIFAPRREAQRNRAKRTS